MKTTARIFVESTLLAQSETTLPRDQAHYLANVLRLRPGDPVRVFNSRDGEFLAYLTDVGKNAVTFRCENQVADAAPPPDIDFLFAPLKHARLDYAVQKAVELGARRLRPVITARTIVTRLNLDRMRANVIEAAEQCNLIHVPDVMEPKSLRDILAGWDQTRALIYCDEVAPVSNPLATLKGRTLPAAVLVGPEGGFTTDEKAALQALPFVTAISLGPRIMRADTAAVAALTLVQAVLGDWHHVP